MTPDEIHNRFNESSHTHTGDHDSVMMSPIINFEKKVEAAVGISGPTLRMKPEKDGIARLLKDVGEELSEKLGHKE